MKQNAIRLSQLIFTFGPGAMVDLPNRSVVVGGLEFWDMKGIEFKTISEPRLLSRMEMYLKSQNLLDQEAHLELKCPPHSNDDRFGYTRGISSPVFPAWFICENVEEIKTSAGISKRRRLVRWTDLDTKWRKKFQFENGTKSEVTPIRFVSACPKGHLQDINWRWMVHQGESCQEPMWLEDRGTSAHLSDTSIICGCGKGLSLQEIYSFKHLGKCKGERPWLFDQDPDGCNEELKLLTRTAVNTYFPQVYTVISLPSETDELTRLLEELSGDLINVLTVEDVTNAKRLNPKVNTYLENYEDEEIFLRLKQIREGADNSASSLPKAAEFDVLASGQKMIGENNPNSKLYAETLPRDKWTNDDDKIDLSVIKNLVAVHKLRVVSCQYGFTRFEANPISADDNIEDVKLDVRSAPLSRDVTWLPAIEQFGEGLFIHFDENSIKQWQEKPDVQKRIETLTKGLSSSTESRIGKLPDFPGTTILLHSLSHALMTEIALYCGYPSSSLKERIYALPKESVIGSAGRCGILIYTATPGAQGTLGGLVATSEKFSVILERALERLKICSYDPVCADHETHGNDEERATHGAACHVCLLISETSCEMRNLYLDRSLLVETMANQNASLFNAPMPQ